MPDPASPAPARHRAAPPCPICRRAAQPATLPFCSPRCAQVDLGRWLTGQYVAPGSASDTGEQSDGAG